MGVDIWSVVLTHNRHRMLDDLMTDLHPERTVIVDHQSAPPVEGDGWTVLRDDGPVNISRLWNLGLDYVQGVAAEHHHVAVLNDDLRIPPGTLERLSEALTDHAADVAFPDVHGLLRPDEVDVVRGDPGPHNLFRRMTGYVFMLDGSSHLRADEELVFWYGDDDVEWRATARRGTVRVGGATVEHLTPNGSMSNPALVVQAAKDRETFVQKWGMPPW